MHGRQTQMRFGGPLTPVVKKLLIINGAIFLLQLIANLIFSKGQFSLLFGLSHAGFVMELKLWQVFTYMFLHGGFFHILFNLFALWMFGGELEELWGSKNFLKFYIYSGIGAGIFISLLNFYIYQKYGVSPVTIGASGAIYALLLAYAMTWPNREIYLYFLIPIKIKYFVLILGVIEFFSTLSSASGRMGSVSHIGHLGGLASGFLIIRFMLYKSKTSQTKKTNENIISKVMKKARVKKKKKDIKNRIKAKKIIDDLLEKIARTGMSSLTPEEKRNLEWARKHYYPEGNDTLH